ncbi:hypothetical protein [Iamia sp.]|nr:hypothetical protein [Iamia sp.]HXH59381.1 hypothetical protein [Iamia sp.]
MAPRQLAGDRSAPLAGPDLRDHVGLDATAEVIEADLAASYVETLWHPGT